MLWLAVAEAVATEGECGGLRAATVSAGGGRGRRLFAASIVLRQQFVVPIRQRSLRSLSGVGGLVHQHNREMLQYDVSTNALLFLIILLWLL